MATAGTVTIVLDGDSAKLVRELAKAQKSSTKTFKSIRKEFNQFATRAGIATTAAAAALTVVVKRSIDLNDALAKTSQKLGLTTEALAGLRLAAEQTGVKSTQLDLGIQRMTRRLAEAAQGTGEAKLAIRELGLDAQALNRLTIDEQFKAIAGAMAEVESQSDRIRLGFKLFDSEGVALINTLALGKDGLDAFAQEAKDLGIALNAVEAGRIEAARDAINLAQQSVTGLGNKITIGLAPAIQVAAEEFANFVKGVNAGTGGITNSSIALVGTFGQISDALTGIEIVARTVGLAVEVVIKAISTAIRAPGIALAKIAEEGFGFLKQLAVLARKLPGTSLVNADKTIAALQAAEAAALNFKEGLKFDNKNTQAGLEARAAEIAALTGELGNGSKRAEELANKLREASAASNVALANPETIRIVADELERAGYAGVDAKQRLTGLIVSLQEASITGGEAAAAFKSLGIDATALANQPLDKQLIAVSEALGNVDNDVERTALSFALFKANGGAMIEALQGAENQLKSLQETAEDGGITGTVDVAGVKAAQQDLLAFSLQADQTRFENRQRIEQQLRALSGETARTFSQVQEAAVRDAAAFELTTARQTQSLVAQIEQAKGDTTAQRELQNELRDLVVAAGQERASIAVGLEKQLTAEQLAVASQYIDDRRALATELAALEEDAAQQRAELAASSTVGGQVSAEGQEALLRLQEQTETARAALVDRINEQIANNSLDRETALAQAKQQIALDLANQEIAIELEKARKLQAAKGGVAGSDAQEEARIRANAIINATREVGKIAEEVQQSWIPDPEAAQAAAEQLSAFLLEKDAERVLLQQQQEQELLASQFLGAEALALRKQELAAQLAAFEADTEIQKRALIAAASGEEDDGLSEQEKLQIRVNAQINAAQAISQANKKAAGEVTKAWLPALLKIDKQHASAYGSMFSSLQTFASGSGRVQDAMFKAQKAYDIGSAIASTWAGVAMALKLPYPANIAAAAHTLAQGFVAIGGVKSAAPGGGSTGGSIGGGGNIGISTPTITEAELPSVSSIAENAEPGEDRAARKTVNVQFIGDNYGWDEYVEERVIESLQRAVEDRDVVIVSNDSRNGKELSGVA